MECDAIQAVSGNHGKLRGAPRKGTLAMRSWDWSLRHQLRDLQQLRLQKNIHI